MEKREQDISIGRQELQDIRKRAEDSANTKDTHPHWVRAFLALSDAANNLDAMIARTSERSGMV